MGISTQVTGKPVRAPNAEVTAESMPHGYADNETLCTAFVHIVCEPTGDVVGDFACSHACLPDEKGGRLSPSPGGNAMEALEADANWFGPVYGAAT